MKNQFIKSIFTCLIIIIQCTNAMGGDATSYDPTSVSVQAKGASDTPIGSVIAWPYNTIPEGWLECNGQSTSVYPDLAAIVGSKVPDLRGQFIRGHDSGKGIDPGRSLLSNQNDAMESHKHTTTITVNGAISIPKAGSNWNGWGFKTSTGNSPVSAGTYSGTGSGTSTSAGSGSENRPVNIAFKYIIKAQ